MLWAAVYEELIPWVYEEYDGTLPLNRHTHMYCLAFITSSSICFSLLDVRYVSRMSKSSPNSELPNILENFSTPPEVMNLFKRDTNIYLAF